MAARNRPRNGLAKDDGADAHEERTMWNSIVNDLRKLKTLQTRAAEVSKQQVDLEARISKSPTLKDIDTLQDLYREGVRLAEEEQKMLNEEPSNVIKNVSILAALRSASEAEAPHRPHNQPAQTQKHSHRNPKRQKLDLDGTVDSPSSTTPTTTTNTLPSTAGTTPQPPPSAGGVHKLKGQNVMRSVSVPRQAPSSSSHDPIVKIEEGSGTNSPITTTSATATATNTANTTPAAAAAAAAGAGAGASASSKPTTPSAPSNPLADRIAKLTVGAEVAYKQSRPREDGSQWIQCHIISISGEGKSRRYEVADPEPDESTGAPGAVYKTSAAALIPIPPKGEGGGADGGGVGGGGDGPLKELPVGKNVLARYPETTTFYRAEVRALRRDKQGGEVYRLSFEDDNQELDVPRRYVLDVQGRW